MSEEVKYSDLPPESEIPTDITGKKYIFDDGRSISVGGHDVSSDDVYIEIKRPLEDGKTSVLRFRISDEAAGVLAYMIFDAIGNTSKEAAE